MKVRVAHSPDPDDAFMAWAMAAGVVRDPALDVELVPKDIQALNEAALGAAPYEATAMSAATYARVAPRYWLLPHGASFGDGYGPILVAREPLALKDLEGVPIATPGELTTATAALRMALPGARCEHRPFDEILPAVLAGEARAGLLIHEGQITWQRMGLHKLLDLGAWWKDETNLPLPLGVTALRKDLGPDAGARLNRLMAASIRTGLARRGEALAYARQFGRGIAEEDADRFVAMYVNDLTVDMGERGLRAVEEFLHRAGGAGLVPAGVRPELAPS